MKYVTVRDSSILYELGGIQGPILNPTWMDIDTVKTLVYNRRTVCEHAITDPLKYVILTKSNYDDFNIYPGNSEIIDPSVNENTFVVSVADATAENMATMAAGTMYIEILDE
jgi:hypothetical protein